MNIYTGFLPQNNFNFNINIQDIYQYNSGIIYFKGSGLSSQDTNIFIKNNAIFDKNQNFVFSLDPIYGNFISGSFYNNTFQSFFSRENNFSKKVSISNQILQNNSYISGIGFSGFKKDQYLNAPSIEPDIFLEIDEVVDYSVAHSGGEYSNSDLYFNFNYSNTNIVPIQINNISITTSTLFSSFLISGLQFPIIINPGENFLFTGYNNNNNFSSQLRTINVLFQTSLSDLNYRFELASQGADTSAASVFPALNIGKNLDYAMGSNLFAYWFFNLNDARGLSNIYFEVTAASGESAIDRLYTNESSQRIFGYEPAAYTNTELEEYWAGSVNNNQQIFSGNQTSFYEDFGNIQNLKNFSWTQPWSDSLMLNDSNYVTNLLKITKTGFNINDINLYLYSKNNSSGILNWSIYKIFTTGQSDGYKNILSGLGFTTGDFINGFPSGFPSGFPFQNRNVNGFFSGFGFGKLSGYMLTGNPVYSGSLDLQQEKLTPENAGYEAPIYKNKNIKIATGLNIPSTGFYALVFSAIPNTSIQNETGVFWPKMWPTNSLPPNQQDLVQYDSGKYFYQSGFENSGNAYSGIPGVSFVANLISKNSGLLFTGIDYNVALGINQIDNYFNKIFINYNNTNLQNTNFNYNFVKFTITKNLSSGAGYEGLDYGSGIYKISGGNFLQTGVIGVRQNIYRQNEVFFI